MDSEEDDSYDESFDNASDAEEILLDDSDAEKEKEKEKEVKTTEDSSKHKHKKKKKHHNKSQKQPKEENKSSTSSEQQQQQQESTQIEKEKEEETEKETENGTSSSTSAATQPVIVLPPPVPEKPVATSTSSDSTMIEAQEQNTSTATSPRPPVPSKPSSAPPPIASAPPLLTPSLFSTPTKSTFLEKSGSSLTDFPADMPTELTKLLLSKNLITSIPSTINQLAPTLTILDVSYNRLLEFSPALCALGRLQSLNLGGNRISKFPTDGSLSQLTSLTTLTLRQNKLESFPAQLLEIPFISELDLARNKLIELPASLSFEPWRGSLTKLDLRWNLLKELPSNLSSLEWLSELRLSENELVRLNSQALTGMISLSLLDLSSNELTELPDEMKSLSYLNSLVVKRNKLSRVSGEIFERYLSFKEKAVEELQAGEYDALQVISFYGNRLKTLPSQFWQSSAVGLAEGKGGAAGPALTGLDLGSNLLEDIPADIANFVSLTDLNLVNNKLSTLPEELGQLQALTTLNVSENNLRALPTLPVTLTKLYAAYNSLDSLPDLSALTDLEELFLNGNPNLCSSSEDAISSIWLLPNVRLMYLSDIGLANFSSTFATGGAWGNAQVIDLSFNRLPDIPPEAWESAYSLQRINLSHNLFETVPEALGELYELEEADFSFNQISQENLDASVPIVQRLADRGAELILVGNHGHVDHQAIAEQIGHGSSPIPPFELGSVYQIGIAEMKGRRPTMEDAWSFEADRVGSEYFGLYDGHAGRISATFAAGIAHKELRRELETHNGDIFKAAPEAFKKVNTQLQPFLKNSGDPNARHSGTTGVFVIVDSARNKYLVANVGDSRAVLGRENSIVRLSHDHKPHDDEEESRIRDQLNGNVVGDTGRINGFLAVSRSLGDFYMHPWVTCEPFVQEVDIRANDQFLIIACDGVWDEVSDEEGVELVRRVLKDSDPRNRNHFKAAMRLRDFAYLVGSDDNISVIVVDLNKKSP